MFCTMIPLPVLERKNEIYFLKADLEEMLKEYGKPVCEYLRATRKVYELSMAQDVSPDYPEHFEEFRRTFLVLHKMVKLPWTLKVHILMKPSVMSTLRQSTVD